MSNDVDIKEILNLYLSASDLLMQKKIKTISSYRKLYTMVYKENRNVYRHSNGSAIDPTCITTCFFTGGNTPGIGVLEFQKFQIQFYQVCQIKCSGEPMLMDDELPLAVIDFSDSTEEDAIRKFNDTQLFGDKIIYISK